MIVLVCCVSLTQHRPSLSPSLDVYLSFIGLPDLGTAAYWKLLLLRFDLSAEYVIEMEMIRHFGKPDRSTDCSKVCHWICFTLTQHWVEQSFIFVLQNKAPNGFVVLCLDDGFLALCGWRYSKGSNCNILASPAVRTVSYVPVLDLKVHFTFCCNHTSVSGE